MGMESQLAKKIDNQPEFHQPEIIIDQEKNEGNIEKEFQEAKENFAGPINLVKKRYEDPNSALKSPEQLEAFEKHNEEVLELCIKRGVEKGLSEKELKILEVSAILHDLNKADKPEKPIDAIPNYTLAAHGEMAASEIKNILNDYPEVLNKILGENYSEEEKEETTSIIKNAIRSHMGPHPGFMDGILEIANKHLKKMGKDEIKHPYPDNKIAETLLAVDMASLAGSNGRKKVLAIRSAYPFFKKQDEDLCNDYKELKIDLTPGEAALLSGFDSADQARDMLKEQEDKEWVNQIIEDSKNSDYFYEGEKLNYQTTIAKRKEFQDAQMLEELREKIKQTI